MYSSKMFKCPPQLELKSALTMLKFIKKSFQNLKEKLYKQKSAAFQKLECNSMSDIFHFIKDFNNVIFINIIFKSFNFYCDKKLKRNTLRINFYLKDYHIYTEH